ncbi:MAG: phosphotransferase enzyme family protein [Acidiferrobacterales bacterium]
MKRTLSAIAPRFALHGRLVGAIALRGGHIHDTFVTTYVQGNQSARYVHQRINQHVFPHPERLMENIVRVITHLREKLSCERTPDPARRALTLVHAENGKSYFVDQQGAYWRTYVFIEGTYTHDTVDTPDLGRRAGAAFGRFGHMLADLPGPSLHETIRHFHDTRRYYQALCRAAVRDDHDRAMSARSEIDFAIKHESIMDLLDEPKARGELVERVVHNDTKINNVLFDIASNEALCVIDLDTVMSGLVLHDFGDLARTSLSPSAEDERDLARVYVRLPVFEALVEGYLETATPFLNACEIDLLPAAARMITFETGVRFLRDGQEGDQYFKVRYPSHNLARARTQFRLLQSMEQQQDAMSAIVERVRRR